MESFKLPVEFLSKLIPAGSSLPSAPAFCPARAQSSQFGHKAGGAAPARLKSARLWEEPGGGYSHRMRQGGKDGAHSHVRAFLSLSLKEREANSAF